MAVRSLAHSENRRVHIAALHSPTLRTRYRLISVVSGFLPVPGIGFELVDEPTLALFFRAYECPGARAKLTETQGDAPTRHRENHIGA